MTGPLTHLVKAVNEHVQVSNSDIADLLNQIQAPPTLQSFFHHIPLLPEVLEAAETIAKMSCMDAYRFRKTLATAKLLASVAVELEADLRYRDFRPPVPAPRFGPCQGLFGNHPLYSALADSIPFKEIRNRFIQLKAQILLAMASLDTNEQELADILHGSFTAFRALTKPGNRPFLEKLPADPVTVDTFSEVVKVVFRQTKFQSVCKIFEIAEHRLKRKKLERKKPVIRKQRSPQAPQEDDENQATEYLKDALPSTTLTQKESDEYRDHGGLPEGLGSDIDLEPVLAPGLYHGPTLRQLALQAQQGHNHRAMLNQFCAMAWNHANLFDMKVLFEFLEGNILLDHFDYAPLTRDDVIVILGLMLFTCNPLERVLSLSVFPGRDPQSDSIEGVYQKNGDPVQVRLSSYGPDLSGPRKVQGAVPVTRYSTIQLPPFFTNCLERIGNPLSSGAARSLLINTVKPADDTNTNNVLSILRGVMGAINSGSGARLSLGRLSSYLLFRVAETEHTDLPGAMLYFGRNDKFARTRIHYTLADSRQLTAAYQNCTNTLLEGVGCTGRFGSEVPASSYCYLGTPLCPEKATVRRQASVLRAKLDTKSLSMVDRHNYFTLYTSMLISYGTGFRAINDPSFREIEIDPRWGIGIIADKGTAAYRSRYVYLAPVVLEQIRHYREHIQSLYAHLGIINPTLFDLVKTNDSEGLPLNLFWLSGDIEPLELLTPGTTKIILADEFNYKIPLNAGRHYLKYHLIKAGCSPELVEAQLGHWEAGQEPWGPFSNLDPLDFIRQLACYIPDLMESSGWLAVDRNGQ